MRVLRVAGPPMTLAARCCRARTALSTATLEDVPEDPGGPGRDDRGGPPVYATGLEIRLSQHLVLATAREVGLPSAAGPPLPPSLSGVQT